MGCFRPLRAFEDEFGRIGFRAGPPDSRVDLPCGRCIGCTTRWSSHWVVRCFHESLLHEWSWFVTLTYDQEHVPADLSLSKREWQLFAKRLRKRRGKFRFFATGEYGSVNKRPHFHAVLFGLELRDLKPVEGRKVGGSGELYTSEELVACWGRGFVSVGHVTPESIAYVTKYASKKRGRRAPEERFDVETGETWKVEPEFVVMSRRPGLGAAWFDRFEGDVFPSDECVVRGVRFGVPRYYVARGNPAVVAEVKERRKARAEKFSAECEPARLVVREKVALSRKAVTGR